MRVVLGFAAALAFATAAQAAEECVAPALVAEYLKTHGDWKILTTDVLSQFHRDAWKEFRGGKVECPGLAAVVLDKSRQTSYAVALVKPQADGQIFEQLVVIGGKPGKLTVKVLEEPSLVPSWVVYREGPIKEYHDDNGRPLSIPYDSIVYHDLEGAMRQYYLVNGKFQKLEASD